MNPNYFRIAMPVLFLPFKLKANTTFMPKQIMDWKVFWIYIIWGLLAIQVQSSWKERK